MATSRPSLTPLASLGVGVLLLAVVDVLGNLLYGIGTSQFGGPGPIAQLTSTGLYFVHSALFGAITLGGVYAALTLERFDRPLLVVVAAVFAVTFVYVAVTSVLSSRFGALHQFSNALSTALHQAALVAAVTLVVRSIGVDGSDAPTPFELLSE